MANTISIEVDSLPLVLDNYNQIKVYVAPDIDAAYVEITNSSTRIPLNTQDTLYSFTDNANLSTVFYKTSYFNSSNSQESGLSNPVEANATNVQLTTNMQVVITISKDVKNISGATLADDAVYYFTTLYDPLYSSVKKVRLEIGSFIGEVADDTINLAIFEASLMANEIHWAKNNNNDFFRFARREWVTCKAAEILLTNMIALLGASSKKLDNLEISYSSKSGEVLLDKILNCLSKWEAEVISGGHATQVPRFMVKGEFDIDAPHVGRMWEKGPRVQRTPGSNARYKPFGSRRYIGGWIGQNSFRRGRF